MTYLEELENAVVKRHGCEARHLGTETVELFIQGRGLWRGNVSTFALVGHPLVRRCYAWGNRAEGESWDVITMLGVPPVASAETAVRAAITSRTAPGKSI
jgi:hypothetical protein